MYLYTSFFYYDLKSFRLFLKEINEYDISLTSILVRLIVNNFLNLIFYFVCS